MKKLNTDKLMTYGLIALLCLIFAGMFVYGLNGVLAMEGAYPPVVNQEGKTPAPQTREQVADYLNKVVAYALEQRPRVSVGGGFDVDEGSLVTDAGETTRSAILYVMGGFESALSANCKSGTVAFGDDMTGLLNIPEITAADILEFSCEYIYYACTSCGAENSAPQAGCTLCGSTRAYAEKYRDEYTITARLQVTDALLQGNFGMRTDGEIRALYGDGFDGFLTVGKIEPAYEELTLRLRAERISDQLTGLEYVKKMHVAADGVFEGVYAGIGKKTADFTLTEWESYSFTWPGLRLSADTLVLAPGGTDNLLATLTCDDPLGAVVHWSSSDETLVSVDADGYLDAAKRTGEAVITATFEFQGRTYSDRCTVEVKNAVESSRISKRSLTMRTGEEQVLTITVSPSNATCKTNKWYSEDESVATVDENGCVRAVAPGTVTIYSLTDDGFYKSSCEVTVNE